MAGFLPGAFMPGDPVEGLDGMLGAEKLLDPRIPEPPPPPALAQALEDIIVEAAKKNRHVNVRPKKNF